MTSTEQPASRPPLPAICHGIAISFVFLAGALYPFYRSAVVNTAAALIVLVYAAAASCGRARFVALQRRLQGSETAKNVSLAFFSIIAVIGTLEITGQAVSRMGLLEPHSAMHTLLPQGVADFRRFHITADEYRIPDPVLLWRPVDYWPFNAQHMKGPVAELPKPPETFRIVCYGDSNTDGPNEGTWAERLQHLLNVRLGSSGHRFEVLNAGVAGYSSFQGLLRFRQQVEEFTPDLIFVSFGWNDAAPAVGLPDRLYRPPPPIRVAVERVLIRYRSYRVALKLLKPAGGRPPDTEFEPRVPIEDYLENLRAFGDLARSHAIEVVYLTRPYEIPRQRMLEALHDMRSRVPHYNDALRRFGRDEGVRVIDVYERFAFDDNKPLFADDAHFSDQGLQWMAELLYERLVAAEVLPI